MDYGIALNILAPGAKYRRYGTYAEVAATWEDLTIPLPADADLQNAYAAWELENNTTSNILAGRKAVAATALAAYEAAILDITTNYASLTAAAKLEAIRVMVVILARLVRWLVIGQLSKT